MRAIDIDVDLATVPELEKGLHSVATVYLPDTVTGPVSVIVGYPGSGFTRGYFDVTAKPGYSEAAHHVEQGFVFVACDHVGIGDSTPCDLFALTIESMAAANHATAAEALARLRAGTVAPDVPPVEVERVIGIGQSMGGCLLTVQQALHQTFDAIGLLGWSQVLMNMTDPDDRTARIILAPGLPRDMDLRVLATMTGVASKEVGRNEEIVRFNMHWSEDDPDLVERTMRNLAGDPELVDQMPEWRTATLPACSAQMMTEFVVAPEAAMIDVPILLACGEIDCVPDPAAEPGYYSRSPDVQVVVFERMAHMHNFAQTRAQLWDRISEFARSTSPRALTQSSRSTGTSRSANTMSSPPSRS